MPDHSYEKYQGLSHREALAKLQQAGPNELPSGNVKSIGHIVLEVIREPMFILLIACGSLYLLLGDTLEGVMLMSTVLIIIAITFYQHRKTERALEALRELSSPRALVIRDGVEHRIPGREVVPGDLVVLQEGDRVCADAEVLQCLSLRADESVLTGESEPVLKVGADQNGAAIMESMVYSGTLIVKGHGLARVTHTGTQTRFGKIGKLLTTVKEEDTLLQKETTAIVKTFSYAGFILCSLLVIVYGFLHADWLRGLLAGLSLAMAMLPEEFPVVLTIFMAMGAWRMSKKNVLTRRSASIESLGAVTVLCTDKTGTLTENKMTVRKLAVEGNILEVASESKNSLPEEFHSLVEYAILASQQNPFDPMERAFHQLGDLHLSGTEHLHQDWIIEREYPLSAALLALSHVYRSPDRKSWLIAAKGSPEAIADLCHMEPSAYEEMNKQITRLAEEGLRVLGVARATFQTTRLPENQHDFEFEFLGLIGLEDPLRSTVQHDLQICYEAGVRMIMITGDYPATAQSIALKMGLKNSEKSITGSELDKMSDGELAIQLREVNIFARVSPEHKLRIVNVLKEMGEIVAMTGDGINDAPSLKAAHVGIAMGQRGTDVAREASSLVLLDDNFSSIVAAIRMGRRIYDNIKKAMGYIFSVHIPIAGITIIPALFRDFPMILMPLHIAFMELIIDPACSLIFEGEREEENIMQLPPRNRQEPVFGIRRIIISSFQGIVVIAITLSVYFAALSLNRPEGEIRALTFTTLVIANIGLILINRSWTRTVWETFDGKNDAVRWVILGIIIILATTLYFPPIQQLFHFDTLHSDDFLLCLGAGAVSVLWFEVMKVSRRKRQQ